MHIDDVQQTVHILRAMYRMDERMGDFAEFVTVCSMTDSQGLVDMMTYVCTALHIMIRTPKQGHRLWGRPNIHLRQLRG